MNLAQLQVELLKLPAPRRRFVGMLRRPDGQVTAWEVFKNERQLREWARIVLHVGAPPADGSLPFHARMHQGELRAFRIEAEAASKEEP